jgi:uncharacterized Zn finger protein
MPRPVRRIYVSRTDGETRRWVVTDDQWTILAEGDYVEMKGRVRFVAHADHPERGRVLVAETEDAVAVWDGHDLIYADGPASPSHVPQEPLEGRTDASQPPGA